MMSKKFYVVRENTTKVVTTELTVTYDSNIDIEINAIRNYLYYDSDICNLGLDLVVLQYDSFVGCKQDLIHLTRYSKSYISVKPDFLSSVLAELEKSINAGNLDFEEQGFTLEGDEVYD